jgi:Fe-S oxidoreductase
MREVAFWIAAGFNLLGTFVFAQGARQLVSTIRAGQPDATRTFLPAQRWRTLAVQVFAHTRLTRRHSGYLHWFVAVSFVALFGDYLAAFGLILNPTVESSAVATAGSALAVVALISILGLTLTRVVQSRAGRGRFAGSNLRAGYFVEAVIFIVLGCTIAIHVVEDPDLIAVLAFLKVMVSGVWFIVIGRSVTMGVAWHRFTAFFNIWFKRHADSRPSLGELQPSLHKGNAINWSDPADDTVVGVGGVDDLTWKARLDLATCTECGRCQDACPAWATGSLLSPKLMITSMRDAVFGDDAREFVGGADAVVDRDALWDCTTCGACVVECPVGIEHVDQFLELRRHQVVMESEFPAEFAGLYKNLETTGNPFGAPRSGRTEWIKEMHFPVRVFGDGGETVIPPDVEYLFWVGCAGAYENRAKQTTKNVAELLHLAGVSFMVLGSRENCHGDPARRTGNEMLFQEMSQDVAATLSGIGVKKIVVTCPHCLNTLGYEHPRLNGHYEVVHHTELLAELMPRFELLESSAPQTVTVHDPCYLARHNNITDAPRDVLALAGVTTVEMDRNRERTFCCGAGGGQMWKESTGERINDARMTQAVTTGADVLAVGCPFCSVMMDSASGERLEVKEISEIVLHQIKRKN